MRLPLLLYLLAVAGSALAQPTLTIGPNTNLLGNGVVQVVYRGGALTNNGLVSISAGQLVVAAATTYGGSGTATVANVTVSHSTGSSTLNSLLSVTGRATVATGTSLNANNRLYLRTDSQPTAEMVNNGVLMGFVQGLLTRATATTGAAGTLDRPYSSQLSGNLSGNAMQYQWQSSADNTTWADVAGATATTYTATVSKPIYYRSRLTSRISGYDQTTPGVYLAFMGAPICPQCPPIKATRVR